MRIPTGDIFKSYEETMKKSEGLRLVSLPEKKVERESEKVSLIDLETQLAESFADHTGGKKRPFIWGVPRGGWHIAYILDKLGLASHLHSDEGPDMADIIVDDVVDTGKTKKYYQDLYPDKPFYAPFVNHKNWIVFPWEKDMVTDAEEAVTNIIRHIGDDPKREGLVETPARVVKSWKELYSGYGKDPGKVLKVFTSQQNQMVICKDIEFYSTCEHHMIPFFGKIHIGYLPGGHVVGLSKLARVAEIYARRLQIQEQMTDQIKQALSHGIPRNNGVIVIVEAKHLCMCGRGVGKQNSMMTTSAISGNFHEQPTRNEFLHLVKHG